MTTGIKSLLVLFGCCLFLSVDFANGQVVVRSATIQPTKIVPAGQGPSIPTLGQPVFPAATPVDPAAAAAAATAAAAKETPEQKKMKLLLAAKFDRTTPAVLKAWSDKPVDESEVDPKKEDTNQAVVKNAFEGFAVLEFDKAPKFKVGDVVKMESDGESYGTWKLLTVADKKVSLQIVEEKKAVSASKPGSVPKPTSVPVEPEATEDSEPEVAESDEAQPETEPLSKDDSAKESASNKSDEDAVVQLEPQQGLSVTLVNVKAEDATPDIAIQLQTEVDAFVRDVTLGNWKVVKTFLASMKEEDADKVYAHLLKSLSTPPPATNGQPRQPGQKPAMPYLTPSDIMQLANASPTEIKIETEKKDEPEGDGSADKAAAQLPPGVVLPPGMTIDQLPPGALQAMNAQMGVAVPSAVGDGSAANSTTSHVDALAKLIANSNTANHDFAEFHKQVLAGTRHFGGDDPIKRLTAAGLFMKAGLTQYVEDFLPPLEDDSTNSNLPALKIWSQLALAMHAEKQVAEWLEKAWKINQTIISFDEIEKDDKDLALANLISLSSKIDKEVGVAWMNASFSETPQRGMTILTNLGTKSADMASKAAQTPEQTRLDLLRLQNEAVEKLIKVSPETAKDWQQALTLLAENWLTEAATSLKYSRQNAGRSYMSIDMYGNYYWVDPNQRQRMMGGGRQPQPIKLGDVLEVAPSAQWQELVHESLHTNLRRTKANLHLRINEEDKAFPYIEEIAPKHPRIARDLIHEFIRIWTQNHDPNSDKKQRNPYIYFYGFDRKADAIPLTRSKQERNIVELAGWVDRIRKMPIDDIDEKLLADAFTTCHSSAEVFKLDKFKSVFGNFEDLKPATIAAICQKMRTNLASNWRDIRNQEQKQTNRREPEVQQEVLEGYETGLKLAEEAMETSPDSWELHLATAALMYDQNAYAQSVQKSSEFSDKRDAAFDQFQVAADKYETVVVTLEEKEQSTDVYDYWFYAGLGACDLGKVTDKTVPDLRQYAKVRAAIESLPGNLAESHMAKFANNLFTRMSPIKPEIKFRYLRGGFEIAGDHPRAWEARNLYDYYKDLVSEIQFSVVIDGEDNVGHEKPFGVYVNILHTTEIERESGGFGKYVQNQNSMMYAFNYGRPTENYRDKFTDSVELALGEHFEIENVTFQGAESMESRPAPQKGWRITPYAYVLLKPKGPEVDRIAPLKLDLDFLDTSGYVVIPVESPALVIDCSNENPPMRPVKDLEITQTLDERQASDGKLIVEITASAKGLVPDLDQIVDLKRDNFEVVSVDDQGVLPTAFETDTSDIQILSDRSWTVEYEAKQTEAVLSQFAFSEPKIEDVTAKFQRYSDADLVEVAKTVDLEKNYKAFSWSFLYWLIPAIVLVLVGVTALVYVTSRPKQQLAKRFNMPEEVNPFTVLTLLKDIKARNGISNEQGIELQNSINRVEKFYFGEIVEEQPDDLSLLAQTWIRQAK